MADTTGPEVLLGLLFGVVMGAAAISWLVRGGWGWRAIGGFDLVLVALPQIFRSTRWYLGRAR